MGFFVLKNQKTFSVSELQRAARSSSSSAYVQALENEDSADMKDLVDALMEEGDGVNPKSMLSIEDQLAIQRRRYRKALQFEDLQERLLLALEVIEKTGPAVLGENEVTRLQKELQEIGEAMADSGKTPELEDEQAERIAQAIQDLGQDHFEQGQFKRASAMFSLGAILLPYQAFFWRNLAVTKRECGQVEGTTEMLKVAYDLEPSNYGGGLLLACALTEEEKIEEAKEVLSTLDRAKRQEADKDFDPLFDELVLMLNMH